MHWTMSCPACGQSLRLSSNQQGRSLICPGCLGWVHPTTTTYQEAPPPVSTPKQPGRNLSSWLFWSGIAAVLLASLIIVGVRLITTTKKAPTDQSGYIGMMARMDDTGRGMFVKGGELNNPPEEDSIYFRRQIDRNLDTLLSNGKSMAYLGKIPTLLSAIRIPNSDTLITTNADGKLRLYELPSLRLMKVIPLEKPVYQMTIDPTHRLLYAAVSETESLGLNYLGDRETALGPIFVFTLDAILEHNSQSHLVPQAKTTFTAHMSRLSLTPDGKYLLFIAEMGGREVRVIRIVTETMNIDKELNIQVGGVTAISLSPDGKTLVGISGTRLFSFNPIEWTKPHTLHADGSTLLGIVAANNGIIHLIERHRGHAVLTVDLKSKTTLSRNEFSAHGRFYIVGSANRSRIIVSNSTLLSGKILVLNGKPEELKEGLLAHSQSNRDRLLHGPVFVSREGEYVVLGSGDVFRTP